MSERRVYVPSAHLAAVTHAEGAVRAYLTARVVGGADVTR